VKIVFFAVPRGVLCENSLQKFTYKFRAILLINQPTDKATQNSMSSGSKNKHK